MKEILVCLIIMVASASQTEYLCNYNASLVNDVMGGDPVSLPIILNNPGDGNSNLPLTETYDIRRYELKDTNYVPDHSNMREIEHDILYKKEPPSSVFDVQRVTIEEYQLLERKMFQIMLINPSKFRFCINEIYADSEAVRRI